ncbi:hypothetical protein CEXT_279791 [Caerostris extrusa]|uniref:Uncharacterized protein n=1 Tax=Caerostris extrusa TaxID=172846 RepID=A0AAV4XQQ3_CAEEX|nr:hypothetical protein CEXT_279791 [Caerostris extrusa]
MSPHPLRTTALQSYGSTLNLLLVFLHPCKKVMYKGLCKDEKTLREVSITRNAKVMVVGSTLNDILAVNTPSEQDLKEEKAAAATKNPFCKQKVNCIPFPYKLKLYIFD